MLTDSAISFIILSTTGLHPFDGGLLTALPSATAEVDKHLLFQVGEYITAPKIRSSRTRGAQEKRAIPPKPKREMTYFRSASVRSRPLLIARTLIQRVADERETRLVNHRTLTDSDMKVLELCAFQNLHLKTHDLLIIEASYLDMALVVVKIKRALER